MFIQTKQSGQQGAEEIDAICELSVSASIEQFNDGMRAFWHHPTDTPQQILDYIGSNAMQMLTDVGAEKSRLLAKRPAANLANAEADFQPVLDGNGNPTGAMRTISTLTVKTTDAVSVTLSKDGVQIGAGTIYTGLTEGTYVVSGTLDNYTIDPVTIFVDRNKTITLPATANPPAPVPIS